MNNILAIDPGCHAGIAHTDGLLCTVDLGISPATLGRGLCRLQDLLRDLLISHPTDAIVAEDPAGVAYGKGQFSSTQRLAQIVGVVAMTAERHSLPVRLVNVQTIKGHAGARRKAELVRRAELLLGVQPSDDNQADAAWLLDWATHCWWWPGRPGRPVTATPDRQLDLPGGKKFSRND